MKMIIHLNPVAPTMIYIYNNEDKMIDNDLIPNSALQSYIPRKVNECDIENIVFMGPNDYITHFVNQFSHMTYDHKVNITKGE
jgi:hypothetical protein